MKTKKEQADRLQCLPGEDRAQLSVHQDIHRPQKRPDSRDTTVGGMRRREPWGFLVLASIWTDCAPARGD